MVGARRLSAGRPAASSAWTSVMTQSKPASVAAAESASNAIRASLDSIPLMLLGGQRHYLVARVGAWLLVVSDQNIIQLLQDRSGSCRWKGAALNIHQQLE